MFERSIRDVRRLFEKIGLGRVFAGVTRIRVVREESYHDERTDEIGLNPADARRPFSAFPRRGYLLIHELAHHFAKACLSGADAASLAPLFGDIDRAYRRLPKPRSCGPDFVSRYAMTHPLEDFAETFAVCVWAEVQPGAVARLLSERSPACRRKLAAVRTLIRREARRARASGTAPRRGPPRARRGSSRR